LKNVTALKAKNDVALDDGAIRTLIARIAHLADTGDAEVYAQCFTADARWDMPGAPRRGHADIVAGSHERRRAGEIGPGSATRHVVGTIAVDVDGDRAHARSYFQFFTQTTTAPQLRLIGQYDDEFVRSPSGWLLDHRRITFG
jgi:3-phenylpropionate/cinnamic acid dioxygenase small subunit